MAISLKPEHLRRYKDIALLFIKHGRADLVKSSGLDAALVDEDRSGEAPVDPRAEELATDLEKMGPIFIKLGQVLSSRADFLPLPYLQALSRLQDNVEPFSFAEVEEIVQRELGVRMSKAFAEFDVQPIAAASLGQVHRATLRNGRQVAVKIQRPNIRGQIAEDMEALSEIATFLDDHTEMGKRYQFRLMLDEFRKNLVRELDYRQEARNLVQLRDNLTEFPGIVVPSPVEDYTTDRVLTMDYVRGRKLAAIGPLSHLEKDMRGLAEQVFQAYLKQILVDGLFHADPHPGNVFLTEDGRIGLIDLGMVGNLSPVMQEQLLKLLLAISEGKSEEAVRISIELGEIRENFNRVEFSRMVANLVAQQQNSTVSDIQIGKVVLEVTRISGENGIRTPPEFTMLGKTLLDLDEVGRILDPTFDPNDSIRRNAAEIMRQRMLKSATPGNVFATAIEMKQFVEELPRRVNRILDLAANNELSLNVEAIDEDSLIDGFQKVANRITVGLILAALIIGAALLMRVETSYRILGYPGLAMIFFLLAASGGFILVISILMSDRRVKAKGKKSS